MVWNRRLGGVKMITTETTIKEIFQVMMDANVNIVNVDFDVDDIPARLQIKLTIRDQQAEWKNEVEE